MVKLLDYRGSEEALEQSNNPFALVVLTHLAAKRSRNNPDIRFADMFALAQRMYVKGYDQDTINSLLKFLDWVTPLPKELELQFRDKIHQYEEGLSVQHITSWERLAKAEGREEGIKLGLEKGVKQGVKQGREEGLTEGQAKMRKDLLDTLELALEFKFGKKGQEFLPIIFKLRSPKEIRTFRNRLKTATAAELKKLYR